MFFIPNYRSPDGLGERCKHCDAKRRSLARQNPESVRQNKRKGRVLGTDERARVKAIVGAYAGIIPATIMRRLFRVGAATIDRLKYELEISHTNKDHNGIFWCWYFRDNFPPLPLLNEAELARLFLVTKKWKDSVRKKFDRDPEHIAALESERARTRAELVAAGQREAPDEIQCRFCRASYPPTNAFFRFMGKKRKPVCNVCANYIQARKRWKRLRIRHRLS